MQSKENEAARCMKGLQSQRHRALARICSPRRICSPHPNPFHHDNIYNPRSSSDFSRTWAFQYLPQWASVSSSHMPATLQHKSQGQQYYFTAMKKTYRAYQRTAPSSSCPNLPNRLGTLWCGHLEQQKRFTVMGLLTLQ